jgi:hypothetical protein
MYEYMSSELNMSQDDTVYHSPQVISTRGSALAAFLEQMEPGKLLGEVSWSPMSRQWLIGRRLRLQ